MRKQRLRTAAQNAADQFLCIRYINSAIPLLPKSPISSFKPSSVAVQPSLCQTCSENQKTGFLLMQLIWRYHTMVEPLSLKFRVFTVKLLDTLILRYLTVPYLHISEAFLIPASSSGPSGVNAIISYLQLYITFELCNEKTVFFICENKGADQLRCNHPWFRYLDSATALLLNPKFQASRHHLWLQSPVCVGPDRKPQRQVFS